MAGDYFSHDASAFRDPKIAKLRRKYGLEGYGAFWAVVEALRVSDGYRMSLQFIQDFLDDIGAKREIFDYFFECGLFEKEDGYFFSNSLFERMGRMTAKGRASRENGKKGGRPPASGKNKDVDESEIEPPQISQADGSISKMTNLSEWTEALGQMQLTQKDMSAISALIEKDCIPEDLRKAKIKHDKFLGSIDGKGFAKVVQEKELRLAAEKSGVKYDQWGNKLNSYGVPFAF